MGLPIKSIVKTTIFRQFCGGESIDESEDRISQLARYNVGTILDYCVEGKENDNDFEKTKDEIFVLIEEYILKNPEIILQAFKKLENKQLAEQKIREKQIINENFKKIFHSNGEILNPEKKKDMNL